MKSLYLDITSGIAGDIFLSSLLSFGVDYTPLNKKLSKLLNKKVELSLEKVWRNSIHCNRLIIDCDIKGEPFRHLSTIKDMVISSDFSENVKLKAIKAFEIIAEAESEVHGIGIEEVHFHEIGAVDTIIDILGVCWSLEALGIDRVISSDITVGYGVINGAHGLMPLPAPATLKILGSLPVKRLDIEGELVTPTGAALLKTLVDDFSNSFKGRFIKDSFSTGSLEFHGATNMLRAIILEEEIRHNKVYEIETNIDDMTGENLGYLLNVLIDNKALDVCFIPAYSKKNRPMYILKAMVEERSKDSIINLIFKHSTTAGMRVKEVDRVVADRCFIEKEVLGEKVNIKKIEYNGNVTLSPEWEDCKKIAEKYNISIMEVMQKIGYE